MKRDILLETKDLRKYFPVRQGFWRKVSAHIKAVDGVSFSIRRGETLGLVGESGCGKTTTGRLILRLIEATSGSVFFEGENILELKQKELRKMRRRMQIIFQDPFSSLNPRMTIGETISEALKIHKIVPKNKRKERVAELLKLVGLSPGGMNLYPHEFSGGQRQRIGIARALAVNPSFIVADEPVSALDVSIQAQIINLMMELQEKLNIAYLFIAHDLSVVKHIADRVAVMYLGKIVEEGATHHLFNTPLHPYTKSLLSAVPVPDPSLRERRRHLLRGDVPNPANPPDGCRFHPRCPSSVRRCEIEEPPLREVEPQRSVACHLI